MAPSKPAHDASKIEDAVMAPLGAFEFDNGRVWKPNDFDLMDALRAKGLISNPNGRAESVYLTEARRLRAKELAERPFGAGA